MQAVPRTIMTTQHQQVMRPTYDTIAQQVPRTTMREERHTTKKTRQVPEYEDYEEEVSHMVPETTYETYHRQVERMVPETVTVQVPQQTMEPVQIQVPRQVPQQTTVMVPQTTTEMVEMQVPRQIVQDVVQQVQYQTYETLSEPYTVQGQAEYVRTLPGQQQVSYGQAMPMTQTAMPMSYGTAMPMSYGTAMPTTSYGGFTGGSVIGGGMPIG